ncbi:MAG TPA: cytochrome C oxidase subunit IV family protein [Bacillota bacterium]|nr:cytochrome C oxidase subunit IV family protein [Bacillota bacterium]
MSNDLNQPVEIKHIAHQEGPKRHLITFVISILFTAFAFAAVVFAGQSPFVAPFIVVLALVQVLFQLYIWMHMDQKGHELPAIGIYFGFLIAFLAVVTFVYWLGGY